jgi:hypothetical protein
MAALGGDSMINALLPHVSLAIFGIKMATHTRLGWSYLKLNELILKD